uniref:COMM domain-containing protein n=1 Tax=Guillardia theta TaxID=55529 RepID=A0A7S4KXD4_GUITH|mmetsp:Transcript_32710/g.103546  ORF Transcript_32710/g.103546 Transcript_32710/m.103546 type:complete len:200 (+) Transcript_32710:10-609(+)
MSFMRFRCFGDLDAPDWILAEIAYLSKISSVRMKLIASQVIASMKGQPLDYVKIAKLTGDAGFEVSQVKAAVAVLEYILTNAAKYDCDANVLETELQQLGLPKEHTTALSRPYKESQESLRHHLANQTLKLPGLTKVDWRSEAVLGSSLGKDVRSVSGHLLLETGGRKVGFEISQDKLTALHGELLAAKSLMDSVKNGI